jgi:hypothetical protein
MLAPKAWHTISSPTVKFKPPVDYALPYRSTTLPGSNDAQFLSLAIAEEKYSPERYGHERCNDGERAVAPSPTAMIQKALSYLGTGKGITDKGGGRNGEPYQAIFELCGVCDEDVEDVEHAILTGPVEYLCCGVGLHISTEGHHDQRWEIISLWFHTIGLTGQRHIQYEGNHLHSTLHVMQMAKP